MRSSKYLRCEASLAPFFLLLLFSPEGCRCRHIVYLFVLSLVCAISFRWVALGWVCFIWRCLCLLFFCHVCDGNMCAFNAGRRARHLVIIIYDRTKTNLYNLLQDDYSLLCPFGLDMKLFEKRR